MSDLKVGMIGLDTSHCGAIVGALNYDDSDHHVPGARIAGAFPGGTDMCAVSRDRVGKFTDEMRDKHGVPLYDSIEKLADEMDALIMTSVDGRQHLEQFKLLAPAGKPIFIDKPFTCSFDEAKQLVELAHQTGTPIMSCSSLRYSGGATGLVPEDAKLGSCEVFGTMPFQDDYPRYFWYAVHGAELLFSYMGTGCRTLQTIHKDDQDLLIGVWDDDRIGTVRGMRFSTYHFGVTVYTTKGTVQGLASNDPPGHVLLLQKMIPFLQTGESPVDIQQTLQIMAFLEVAEKSAQQGGAILEMPQ